MLLGIGFKKKIPALVGTWLSSLSFLGKLRRRLVHFFKLPSMLDRNQFHIDEQAEKQFNLQFPQFVKEIFWMFITRLCRSEFTNKKCPDGYCLVKFISALSFFNDLIMRNRLNLTYPNLFKNRFERSFLRYVVNTKNFP